MSDDGALPQLLPRYHAVADDGISRHSHVQPEHGPEQDDHRHVMDLFRARPGQLRSDKSR
jgi:hypothetical protein